MAIREVVTGGPFVSVVIPTHNRVLKLIDCLQSLLALDHPGDGYEIVVVDAASTDDTPERVKSVAAGSETPAVSYLRTASRDANSARNAGLAVARGELVVLIDDDVLVPPGWLSALANGAIQWPESACLGGPVRPLYESKPPRTCEAHELAGVRFDEGPSSKQVRELWGGNIAIRREAFERAGPFRVGLPFQQEWEWEQRLLASGGRLVYLPDAWLWHRRDHADLDIVKILREFFLRGYLQGLLGRPIVLRVTIRKAGQMLRHAAVSRCSRGLTESARELGLVCGALVRRQRKKTRSWKLPTTRPQRLAVRTVQRPRCRDENSRAGLM